MPDGDRSTSKRTAPAAGAGVGGGLWFLGFLGALVYSIHFHSGTVWLVVLAVLKSLVWPAFVVYHVLTLRP